MKTLSFYDLKRKKKFTSSSYRKTTRTVNGRKTYFTIAIAPSGIDAWRVTSKEDYNS